MNSSFPKRRFTAAAATSGMKIYALRINYGSSAPVHARICSLERVPTKPFMVAIFIFAVGIGTSTTPVDFEAVKYWLPEVGGVWKVPCMRL